MEIKRNESTRNRPEGGDRIINAPYVMVDLPSFIDQLKDEKSWEKNDRNGITVFKGGDMTIVISALKKDAAIKDNTTDGFLTIHVLTGEIVVTTPEGDVTVTENNLIVFHPMVMHSIAARTTSVVMFTTNNKPS